MYKKTSILLAAACAAPLMMSPAFAYDITSAVANAALDTNSATLFNGKDAYTNVFAGDGWAAWADSTNGSNIRVWNPAAIDGWTGNTNEFYSASWNGGDASGDADGGVLVVRTMNWDYRPGGTVTASSDLTKTWTDPDGNRIWNTGDNVQKTDLSGYWEWRFDDGGTPDWQRAALADPAPAVYTYVNEYSNTVTKLNSEWQGTAVRNFEAAANVTTELFDSTAKYKVEVKVGRLALQGLNDGAATVVDANGNTLSTGTSTRWINEEDALWNGWRVELLAGGDSKANNNSSSWVYGQTTNSAGFGYIQTLAADIQEDAAGSLLAADSWTTVSIEYTPGVSGDFSALNGENLVIRLGANELADHSTTVNVAFDDIVLTKIMAGDANEDDKVNGSDLALLAANFGQSGKAWGTGDFNGDGSVNGIDLALLAGNFGFDAANLEASIGISIEEAQQMLAAVPEPTSLALLGLGGLLIARRRRA